MAGAPLRVFYSYSHDDVRMLERLRTHMAMLRRQGLISEWYDRDIEAGSEWREEIARELGAADVVLLLVSASFLASDFCYEEEMARAVERARRGDAVVIGVLLRPVDGWESSPFADFQVVPRGARPITRWPNADEAYADAVERIREAIERRPAAEDGDAADWVPPSGGGPALTAEQEADLARLLDPATDDAEVLSPTELALLERIADPAQRREQRREIVEQKAEQLRAIWSNLAQMRAALDAAVRQNLRS